jgi:hypothetical protein
MRRVFVIFLILLFPLNVSALSMSVASLQLAGMTSHDISSASCDALADSDAAPAMESMGDLDSDEPPAGYDFHDSVDEAWWLQCAMRPGRLVPAPLPSRHGLAPFPPIKPPPVH